MEQSETSHAGSFLAPRAGWHGWLPCPALASAASVSVTPAAGYHAVAQIALDKVMQESR